MRRDARVLLTDIDQAGADIQSFTNGMSSEDYAADKRTQAAVERKFEIIGEATNRLHADHPTIAVRIPEMRRIIDFGTTWRTAMTMWRRDSSGSMQPATC